jgi:signal transduction histidine kinase
MAQARRVIWDLRDHNEPVGLLSEELGKALAGMGSRVEFETQLCVEGSEKPLPPVFVHHLVCIGQEAVTNALRHASPHNVMVNLAYASQGLSMTIRDDGCGFLTAEPANGAVGHFGLAVMHERARKIGGDLKICSVPGGGTEVLVSVPAVGPADQR